MGGEATQSRHLALGCIGSSQSPAVQHRIPVLQRPAGGELGQVGLVIVGHTDFPGEGVSRSPNQLGQHTQHHHWAVEAAVSLFGEAPLLLLHKVIQNTHMGCPLTGEVLNAQQLIACQTGGAQGSLHVCPVTDGRDAGGDLREDFIHLQKPLLLHQIPVCHEVSGLENARFIFGYLLVKVGQHLILSRLVVHDGLGVPGDGVFIGEIRAGLRRLQVSSRGRIHPGEGDADMVFVRVGLGLAGGPVVILRIERGIPIVVVGALGIKSGGIIGLTGLSQLVGPAPLFRAGGVQLVAPGHHHKGGMAGQMLQNPLGLCTV